MLSASPTSAPPTSTPFSRGSRSCRRSTRSRSTPTTASRRCGRLTPGSASPTQAWSPLGGVYVYAAADGEPKSALADPVITGIAERYGKTPAQVVLRWHIDNGRSAIPKSVTPSRIAENLDVFDFALSGDDIAAIDALETGVRGGPNQDEIDFRMLGLAIPESRRCRPERSARDSRSRPSGASM